MLASVSASVIVAEVCEPIVIVPAETLNVTSNKLAPASTSLMVSALPFVAENSSGSLTNVACGPGMTLTGASFSAVTLMASVSTSMSAPPVPVLPRSFVTTVTEATPLKLAAGAKYKPCRVVLRLETVSLSVRVAAV